jgi:chromate transporter
VQSLFLAGAIAAIVVTWFTFLPSFLLILGGGPLVESTQNEIRVTAPLTAITAAVVGVIANLALFFAWHVFWPGGFDQPIDLASIALALTALIALLQFRQGVVPVMLVCGIAGFLLKTLA